MMPNIFPHGWDEKRLQEILRHYESQTDDEALAEDEAAFEDPTQALMEVPIELVPVFREIIARHRAA
ncbi:MAG: hypothetical protein IPL60_16845 [Ardenticatenia bacterium]|jgi:hypothetical protein|nr:hypothetical protein [Ardenticatenia bacterium]